jgi:ligand-binding SRPBCC domain-containing protein
MSLVNSINQCVEGKYFVDAQRFGPYKFWHHQHHFEEVQDGVLMKDILHYALPFGPIGDLIGKLFIHDRVRGIFSYREKKLNEIFHASTTAHAVA